MKKRILSLLLSIVMIVALLSTTITAYAATSDKYTYTVSNGKATITDYDCDYIGETQITIPSTLGGYPVTAIASQAFSWAPQTEKITVPDSVTTIGNSAFSGCSKLCNLYIGSGVTELSRSTFSGCYELSNVYISSNNKNYSSSSGILFTKGAKTLLYCPPTNVALVGVAISHTYTIPSSVTSIADYAFSGCKYWRKINVSSNVTEIGNGAFYGCSDLETVTIEKSVTSIGENAFSSCSSLQSIEVSSDNNNYCSVDGALLNKDKSIFLSYPSGKSNTSYTIPSEVKTISQNAFCYSENLTKIIIPDNVSSIKNDAFYGSKKLTEITISDNVRSIGGSAFYNTGYYNEESNWTDNVLYVGNWIVAAKSDIVSCDIKDGTVGVADNAFNYCSKLTGVNINGKLDDWQKIFIGSNNYYLTRASKYYYYFIKFIDKNGNIISEQTCDTDVPFDITWIPTKEENSVELYSDAEMTTEYDVNSTIAQNTNIYVKYTANQYPYYFIDEDGTVLKEATVDYGAEIVPPENPTKQGSAQYSYTFTGWDGFTEGMTQTADNLYFYATYSASVNQYTYKFVDSDGTVLKEKTVNYNTMITPPSNPSKAPDAQYTYTFTGWDGYTVGMKATGDVTFTATYSNTVNQYTYKFVDALGNTILEKTVDYGTVIELPQEEITKAPDDEFTYTFTGWDGYTKDMTVTGNITFAPLFSKTTNKYSYQFVDEDGTVLKEDTVDYGTVITAPSNPSKEADAQYTYTFKGWKGFTEGIKQTAQTMVFSAEYTATVNQYTYKFVDEDGSVIKTQTVDYGTVITPPGNPSKASTDQYSYKFIGWSGYTDGMTVTKDETFKATYEEITNQYTYKFVDYAGNIVKEATVDYGTVIVTPATPDGYSDQQYTYIFASWTGYVRGMKVTKDITFNAKYTSVLNQYTYVFMDENGNLLSEDTVDYGTKITPPEAPEKASTVQYSYEFAGWENYTDGVIVDDVIFIATYKPITNKYTYRFENEDGTEIKTVTADYGSIIEAPRNPQKEATAQYSYKFAGWGGYRDGMTLTGNVTFKATYTSIINQYTYKFTDEDGEVLKELTVDYGTKIVGPDTTPQKDADVQYTYTFKEWNGYTDGMTVTSDVTFVAVYDSILNQYTYKFVNEDGSLVKEQKADYGSVIILPATPSKDATQQYSYKFIGWDGYTDGMTVAGDVVFTAKYTPVINQYTYVFKNDDGTEIKSVTADYGADIIVPENPTKASNVQYSYTFASWSNYISGMCLTEDITFVATYTNTLNQYTYKFIDNDGTELKSTTVDYGTKIVAPSAPADKGAYTFDYWEGFTDGITVAGDVTFKAVYKYKTYNISVDGYEISSKATYGEDYVITPAEKYGYDFVGYYTEVDGNGTKLTDSEGNSLNAYGYEKDITVYPYFADLLVNKAVLSGATSMQVGDTDVKYTLTLGTDRENITYATVFVKYPNSLSISKLEKKADIAEVIQEKDTVNSEYTTTEIVIIYSDDKAMPTKTPIDVFDIYFDVSKTADTKDIAISLTNNSVLMDSTSNYRFAELVGANATIKAKFPESISIKGEVIIDSPTKYTAIVTPDYATYDVEWSVNDASIASITVDGILTPIKNGTVIITAKSLNNPEVFATREITVKAYAKVASITTDGFWTEEFANDINEYTVYVDKDATEFSITPVSASGGRFNINGSTVFSNRTEIISLTEDETEVVITLTGATGYTDNTYILTVVKFEGTKTTVSEDGKSFTITPINIGTGKTVILALYNGEQFVEMQSAVYTGEAIPFTTTKTYTKAKVMVWNDITNLKPVCSVEELN